MKLSYYRYRVLIIRLAPETVTGSNKKKVGYILYPSFYVRSRIWLQYPVWEKFLDQGCLYPGSTTPLSGIRPVPVVYNLSLWETLTLLKFLEDAKIVVSSSLGTVNEKSLGGWNGVEHSIRGNRCQLRINSAGNFCAYILVKTCTEVSEK
jgi:hypothetical protein